MHSTKSSIRENEIAQRLEPLLRQRGFDWLPHLHQFRNSSAEGFSCIILSTTDYEELSLVEAHLGIRIDDVENLAFPFTNGLPGFQPDSMTLVCPLSKLYRRPFQRFEVGDEHSVHETADSLAQQLEQDGFDFLNRYAELEQLEALYNEQPKQHLFLLHNQANRCFRGLVLAKLLGRPNFEELAVAYHQHLKEQLHAPEATFIKFNRLSAFLRHYSQN